MATIFVRITVNGEWTEISLKEKVKASLWYAKSESVAGKSAQVKATNEHTDSVRYRLRQGLPATVGKGLHHWTAGCKRTFWDKHKLQDQFQLYLRGLFPQERTS